MSEETTPNEGAEAAKPAPAPAAAPKPAPEADAAPATIDFDHFVAVDLRVGPVVEASAHPDADRLLVLKVDIGEPTPRQIIAGIRKDWAPEDLIGRNIVVVANLAPRKMRGIESHGMLLAVKGTERVVPLGLEGGVAPGTRVS